MIRGLSRGLSVLLAGMGLSVLLASCAEQDDETFYFSAIPDQDETRLQERFSAVAEYLEGELGVNVEFIPVTSYSAAVTAFRNDEVQLAWFGGLSGVRAQQAVDGARALAQGEEDTRFQTYFIANTETGIEPSDGDPPEALRDFTFTFGSRGSTSGRLMPEHFLREHFGEAPDEFFSRVGYSGNHTRTAALVESGSYDAGALNYKVWQTLVDEGEINTDRVQVVWETPEYLDYHWVIRGDVDARFGEGFTERVREALLNMDDPDLLQRFPRERFIPTSNEDYEMIRETARELDLLDDYE